MSRKEPVQHPPGPDPERRDDGPDALAAFLEAQGRKCAAHHRAQTAEVLELIRKHRKDGQPVDPETGPGQGREQ